MLHRRVNSANGKGASAVAAKAVQLSANINTNNVALLQHAPPRNAMDNLLINGNANRRREPAIPLKKRPGMAFVD